MKAFGTGITTKETAVSKKGMYYVAANGGKIYNQGIKVVEAETSNGINASMKFQVTVKIITIVG